MFVKKIIKFWMLGSIFYIILPIVSGRIATITANIVNLILFFCILPLVSGYILYSVITTL